MNFMKFLKNIALIFLIFLISSSSVLAAKFSDDMKTFIKKEFPNSTLRFDGLVTLPDGTLYLPLYPALVKKPEKIEVREVIASSSKTKPEVIILNNDFVFLKVLKNQAGQKTLLYMKNPPLEVKTGLLPQDMLVPSGLVIPDNIKGIIGNLQIPTAQDNGLRIETQKFVPTTVSSKPIDIGQLKNKIFYVATCYSKNIQVVKGGHSEYALSQNGIIRGMKATPDKKFLLVTVFDKSFVEVISLADDRRIKQIELPSDAGEIVVDDKTNKAYVSSPSASTLYVIDLSNMTLSQKIKLKGKCSRIALVDNARKILYVDRSNNEVWSVELDNDYLTKYIGTFPNISKIAYANGKVYLTSRVANRLAIVDYDTLNLVAEKQVEAKPIDMLTYKTYLYILSAEKNIVQVLDVTTDEIVKNIELNTDGFSTKIYKLDNLDSAIVTDTKAGKFSIINLTANILVKNYPIEVPVSEIVIVPEVRKN